MPNENPDIPLTIQQAGLLHVVIEDFNIHRLDRLNILKEKVDNGDTFSDVDVEFMQESINSAHITLSIVTTHRELQGFCSHVAALYNELTRKGLRNEIRTNS